MHNWPPRFTRTDTGIESSDLPRLGEGWLLTCDIRQHSPRTITSRCEILQKLQWFLRDRELSVCDVHSLRAFFSYLSHGHTDPRGRWGNPACTRPVSPRTVRDYYTHLRTFFRWLVAEGELEAAPTDRIPIPIARTDQVQPYTTEEIKALLAAASRTKAPRRDTAVVLFLLDTGVRASELVGLKGQDLDITLRRARVLGKGHKERTVSFQGRTARALWAWMSSNGSPPHMPVFTGERGPLTRSGLLDIIERLGRAASVRNAHTHRFRHTFAVTFLRAGGNVFTLQQILGHTSLHMSQRYVALAQADIEAQHRQHSPVEHMLGRSR
jgi:site-specific recombinase XerD